MKIFKNNFEPKNQLKELLRKYPEKLQKDGIYIEIFGIILDYLSRSRLNLENFLIKFPNLYT